MEIFGPVQSRRFGLSLGINHLPPKVCSYACVYCQLGRTNRLSIEPAAYADPEQIYRAIQERLKELPQAPDYLTFVSNGEPCLDSQLGDAIQALKKLGIKIAVITNASLLWQSEIRERLSYADAVSLKVDSVQEVIWRKINRPHGLLGFRGCDGRNACFRTHLSRKTLYRDDVGSEYKHFPSLICGLAHNSSANCSQKWLIWHCRCVHRPRAGSRHQINGLPGRLMRFLGGNLREQA